MNYVAWDTVDWERLEHQVFMIERACGRLRTYIERRGPLVIIDRGELELIARRVQQARDLIRKADK